MSENESPQTESDIKGDAAELNLSDTKPAGVTLMAAAESTKIANDDDLLEDAHDTVGRLSYRQLVWIRFKRNRLAFVGCTVIFLFYFVAIFADFFAPYDYQKDNIQLRYVPPQHVHIVDDHGIWHMPFVYGLKQSRDPNTEEIDYVDDVGQSYPVTLFHHGSSYSMLGFISSDIHLFGSDGPLYLLGTDRMGRDLLSRIIFGGRVSLTIGLIGVFLSIVIGALLGTASGYFGGAIDNTIQRLIEVITSFPSIPLWLALSAALPPTWSSVQIYFAITVILSLIGWGGLARQVRGKILATREMDYVLAARASGARDWHILTRHLMPTAYSHIIVIATLMIPGMILGETALSFLGLGIRPPMTSWGVLLEDAQRVTVVLDYPWLLYSALPVLLIVIAYNLVGDALRDAADPYSS